MAPSFPAARLVEEARFIGDVNRLPYPPCPKSPLKNSSPSSHGVGVHSAARASISVVAASIGRSVLGEGDGDEGEEDDEALHCGCGDGWL